MNKKFTFLLAALMLLTMNALTAFGQGSFERVTSSPADWSGEYLLVYESSEGPAFVWNGLDAVNGYEEMSINGGVITATDAVTLLIAPMDGGYSIQINGGDNDGQYIYGQSGSNTIKYSADPVLNTLEYDGESVLMISNTSVMRFNSASNQLRFRYYKESSYTNQQPVQLYKNNGGAPVTPTVSTPTFTPAGGTYFEAQQININCTTEGAAIRYTLDGTNPTAASALYVAPITVNTTTTIKAMAMKAGFNNSGIATATYTIQEAPSVMTIAAARALELNEYAQVQGVVTFIDGRNIYIQDATAGIDLYLNNNTVPDGLAMGDMVRAYGKLADYKGLIELTGINGTDDSEFSILSNGNALPMTVKTIAEIMADFENGINLLQSTRVKIENATVGPINNANNTPITQGENTFNIYKLPVVDGLVEGDVITVTGVIGCYNVPQLRVASADDVSFNGPVMEQVATPVIAPAEGTFSEPVEVSISCATAGASIYYTLDGSNPSVASTLYSAPITINTTTTIKAMAMKAGYTNSSIATATYTIQETPTAITIAAARTLDLNEYALVQGVVTFIDGRNIYIQDATAGIDLYLNNNTVPEGLTMGDLVMAYGKLANYKGLIELTGINGMDNTQFSILSSGNALPLAVKTIAEIMADFDSGTNLLQSTRVKIEDATIGAINNAGNTPITQGESTFIIYKLPVVDGLAEGDLVTVTGVIGCFNTPQLRVATADDVTFNTPVLEQVATPTISPMDGTYTAPVEVSISCATEGASIYYTIDGSDPTVTSMLYNAPFTVNATTTVKAMATKAGYIDSEVATALYTFTEVMTIADAHALNNNEFALVEGVVTFIDGRNIYIQDATGGIVLYLNSNTVPESLAIGDLVRGYGKKSVYKGLVELSNINGADEACFSIISSGNELPLAVKTIEECLAGADDLLQSTRVMIQDAVLGAVTPSGNTELTQGDQVINIYKIPAAIEAEEGDHVNVTAVIGYFNAAQLRVAYPEDVVRLNTNLLVSPMALQGFTYEQGEGPSAPMTFTINGQYLNETVTVTAENYFELSTSANGTYSSMLTLNTVNGIINETVIYVRLMAGLTMDNYSSTISVISGANEASVSLNGTVTISNIVATPAFSVASGAYMNAQTVAISCETEGAVIHYTTDGSEPIENSTVYTEPILVENDMTIKAMATKPNWMNSAIATATYEILSPVTIAEARQLANNQYAIVEGIVTHIDNRNIYIQDKTAGIVLYLNNNSVPSELAVGDKVRGFGRRSTYSGLVELAGINGNDENQFAILSSGNTLPLKNKSIAQLLTDYDGENMLQSTRVRITQAILRSINSNGNSQIEQDGNVMNIYKMPIVEGLMVGDFVTVTGVVGCFNAPQLLVRSSEDIVFSHRPTLTADLTTMTGFEYIVNQGPSAEQSVTVNGINLAGNIKVTAPEHFEISTGTGEYFIPTQAVIFFPENGMVSGANVYVRLKAGLDLGQYNNEMLVITSNNADNVYVSCSGNVHEQSGPVSNDWRRIHSLSDLSDGCRVIITARYDNENTDSYYAMTASTSGKPEGVLFTSVSSAGVEVLPSNITGSEDTYAWTVGRAGDYYTFTNASGNLLGYSSSTNFATGGDNAIWTVSEGTSIDTGVMVSNYSAFNIINANVTTRAAALNNNHNFGPYSTSNMTNGNGANYNFYLDLFVNNTGGTPVVSAPVFAPEGGTYYETQEVTIICATENATIYYSDESEEGPWTLYETPIAVTATTTLWAYAEKEGYNNSAVVSAEYIINAGMTVLFNQDWEGDWNGWTSVSVLGEYQWGISSYGGNHYAYANAYNHGANETWLISPAFDLDAHPDAVLSFRTANNYNGPVLEVYFSNDYDGEEPGSASWEPIECELSTGSWNWVETGELSLESFSGNNCYIAFRYQSTEDAAAGWEVDDITLYTNGGSNEDPFLNVTPNALSGFTHLYGEGPSEAQSFMVSGGNLVPLPGSDHSGVTIQVTGNLAFLISLDGENYESSLSINVDETLEPTEVFVKLDGEEIGTYLADVIIESSGVTATVSLSGEVLSADQPFIEPFMPYYIQGNNGSNNNRVPLAVAVYFSNMEPSTTYRYVNQYVDDNDGPETAGAGNVIYAHPEGFYRSTSPSLSAEGGYGEFTTNEDGDAFVWMINEPTANARFTPGNHVYLRIRTNDGHDGTEVAHIFTTEDYATVLTFGTESDANQGSAFYVKTNDEPMTFAMLFADDDFAFRPIYSTSIETTGVDYTAINQYADFYQEEVSGKNGYFGGILPNDNDMGINIIWILDMESYVINEYYTEGYDNGNLDGLWGEAVTANPTCGMDSPIFIDLTDVNVAEMADMNVKVWNTRHEILVDNAETSSLEMTVYNILGQPVMHKSIAGESHLRFAHDLADGLYVITLQNANSKMSIKILVR